MADIRKLENSCLEHYDAEEEVGRLSFSNLTMGENNSGSLQQSPRTSSPQIDQLFEFFTSQSNSRPVCSNPDIIFCGKIIHQEEELNEYQKRDYFATVKSHSFRKSSITDRHESRDIENSCITTEKRRYSSSTRYSSDPVYHVQRVNITALTSMSAKSRRRMFMFGPVKFKPEMELSEIKQRQARKTPAEKSVVSGGGKSDGGRGRLWSVVRSNLRGRSSVLARSFGCIPVGSGVERWIGVAN